MRILHLSSLYPPHIVGGCERSVEHLAEELVAMGHTVGAACIERQAEAKVASAITARTPNRVRFPNSMAWW